MLDRNVFKIMKREMFFNELLFSAPVYLEKKKCYEVFLSVMSRLQIQMLAAALTTKPNTMPIYAPVLYSHSNTVTLTQPLMQNKVQPIT